MAQARDGVFSPGYRALSIGILVLMTSIAVEGMAVATIVPTAATELGGLEWYGWAFSAFMLTSLLGAIGGGELADKRSPAVAGKLALALFAVGLLVAGCAPSWPVLLVGRAFQGFGAGGMGTLAYLAVARGYPEPLRPRLLALLSSAWVLPALVGPALAGQVAEHATWRLVFLGILVPVGCGAAVLVPALGNLPTPAASPSNELLRGAPENPRDPRRLRHALQLALGMGIALFAAGSSALFVAIGIGLVGVTLSVPALRALLPPGTLSARPGLPAAVGIRGLLAFGFLGCEALVPLGLAQERGLPPSLVGLALTASALTWVAGTWLQDRAENRADGGGVLGTRGVRVRIGLGLVLVGIVGVALVVLSPTIPVVLSVLAWAVGGLGMGLAYPGSTLVALGDPRGQGGFGAASLLVAETVGIAAGAGAGGALVAVTVHVGRDLAFGLGSAFALSAAAIVLALLPAFRLMLFTPQRAPAEAPRREALTAGPR